MVMLMLVQFLTLNCVISPSLSLCCLQEFVMGLSVLSRGSLQERLQWAFSLYDINGDGIITKDEMLDIVTAIYEMMGRYTEPSIDDNTAKEHVERVFQVCARACIVILMMMMIMMITITVIITMMIMIKIVVMITMVIT